jgi:hypothetical protein
MPQISRWNATLDALREKAEQLGSKLADLEPSKHKAELEADLEELQRSIAAASHTPIETGEIGDPVVICLPEGWELVAIESAAGAHLREVRRVSAGDLVREEAHPLTGSSFPSLEALIEAFKREHGSVAK